MELLNLKRYRPDGDDSCVYLISSDGKDWYESQGDFSSDKIKIVVDENSTIVSFSQDVSMLYPINCSVYEVDSLPTDFDIDGTWKYVDGLIFKTQKSHGIVEQVSKAQVKIALLNEGLLDDIESYFNSQNVDRVMQIAWQDAQFFTRSSPFIASMQRVLNLEDSQVDDLFLKASEIQL